MTKKDAMLQFLETWGKTFRENAVLHESKKDERYLAELRLMLVCANCIYILASDPKRLMTDEEMLQGIDEWIALVQSEAVQGVLNKHYAGRLVTVLIEIRKEVSFSDTEGVQGSLF